MTRKSPDFDMAPLSFQNLKRLAFMRDHFNSNRALTTDGGGYITASDFIVSQGLKGSHLSRSRRNAINQGVEFWAYKTGTEIPVFTTPAPKVASKGRKTPDPDALTRRIAQLEVDVAALRGVVDLLFDAVAT